MSVDKETIRKIRTRQARNMAKKRARQREIIANVIMTIVIIVIIVAICVNAIRTEPRYAIASETQTNGNHYIYVTERKCTVMEIENDSVIVSYKGNEYVFYGNGYEVGTEIICQFTDEMEIVGVVE